MGILCCCSLMRAAQTALAEHLKRHCLHYAPNMSEINEAGCRAVAAVMCMR